LRQAKKAGVVKVINPINPITRMQNAAMNQEELDQQMGKVTEKIDSMLVETEGKDIRTAEQSMEYCGVDPDAWTITKKIVNFWDMGEHRNWQVKVWLAPKNNLSAEAAVSRLVKRLPAFKYSKFKPLNVDSKSGNLGIICNFDVHMGKLAWDVETGQGDYDLPISEAEVDWVTDQNLSDIAPMKPEKMIFIIGEDMMHYENLEGVTPKGRNILDTDGRLAKLQDVVIDTCVRNILKCRALAPTEVILVQGNHDQTSSLWLSKVLRAWFRNDPHVTVDCEPKLRKHRVWGDCFIGMSHKIMPGKIAAAHGEFSTG
jgi:hypothetical protein